VQPLSKQCIVYFPLPLDGENVFGEKPIVMTLRAEFAGLPF